jgi:hypothetical protein
MRYASQCGCELLGRNMTEIDFRIDPLPSDNRCKVGVHIALRCEVTYVPTQENNKS